MESKTLTTKLPRYEEFSWQQRKSGLDEFIRVFRDAGGNLHTQTYYEKPNHMGEVKSFKPVNWKEKVPAGVALRGSNGGQGSGAIPNYWVAWQEGGILKAHSIYQEDPLALPMDPQDSLVDGPLLGSDGTLHVYFLRKGPQGLELLEHRFVGEAKKKGHASTLKLAGISGEPLFIRAVPIAPTYGPGVSGPRDVGTAVIGWLTRDGDGLRAHAAWLDPGGARLFASDPIAGYAPFPTQRIDLWANPDSSRLRMAWIMGRSDNDTLRPAEWTLWAMTGGQSLRIDSRGLDGSNVQSAATVMLKNDYVPNVYCYYLTRTGSLYEQGLTQIRKIREGVPSDYDFPIFASAYGQWEARVDRHGEVYFYLPSWMEK